MGSYKVLPANTLEKTWRKACKAFPSATVAFQQPAIVRRLQVMRQICLDLVVALRLREARYETELMAKTYGALRKQCFSIGFDWICCRLM